MVGLETEIPLTPPCPAAQQSRRTGLRCLCDGLSALPGLHCSEGCLGRSAATAAAISSGVGS